MEIITNILKLCGDKINLSRTNLKLRILLFLFILGELATILDKMSKIELGDLKITFDLTCLTLPTEEEMSSPRKPHVKRMLSSSSVGGNSTESSDGEETVDRSSFSYMYEGN